MSSENKLYFSHDFYSRDNLSNLRMKCGLEGYGIYWCLVEIMHENGGKIKESDIDGIAYNLHTDVEKIQEVIKNCDTFISKKGVITSKRVLDNIEKREKISAIRREAVAQRWNKPDESELPEVKMFSDDEHLPEERQRAVDFYVCGFEKWINDSLNNLSDSELFSHSVYDYRNLYLSVINEVKDKDYVVVNGQKIPTYLYLQTIMKFIHKKDNSIENLDKAVSDVEKRYAKGLIKNKLKYMVAALYNAANLDTK